MQLFEILKTIWLKTHGNNRRDWLASREELRGLACEAIGSVAGAEEADRYQRIWNSDKPKAEDEIEVGWFVTVLVEAKGRIGALMDKVVDKPDESEWLSEIIKRIDEGAEGEVIGQIGDRLLVWFPPPAVSESDNLTSPTFDLTMSLPAWYMDKCNLVGVFHASELYPTRILRIS